MTFIVATLLLSHINNHIIHLFFCIFFSLFKLFFPLISKKKKLFFSLLVNTPTITCLSTFSFPLCLFISPLLYRYTSFLFFYILTLLLPILFCINVISFFHSIHIFSTQNCEFSLSLSLSEFLFFLITLINVDIFFLICVLVSCFFFFF